MQEQIFLNGSFVSRTDAKVSIMDRGFLFGDGVAAFVMTKSNSGNPGLKIGKITHAVNFNDSDYRKACVRLVGNVSTHTYEHELTAGSDILHRTLD